MRFGRQHLLRCLKSLIAPILASMIFDLVVGPILNLMMSEVHLKAHAISWSRYEAISSTLIVVSFSTR